MSDDMDEELLNSFEDEYSDYEIDNDKEDALLKDDESDEGESNNRIMQKRKNLTDLDEKLDYEPPEEDVLDLDYEEDEEFSQVEDKQYEENQTKPNNRCDRFTSERQQQVMKKTPPKTILRNRPIQKDSNRPPHQIQNRRNFRGNFHQRRGNHRNNNRRNGTVYINQNYQGVVQLTDNKTRLAWDSNKPQMNVNCEPWLANQPQNNPRNSNYPSQIPSIFDLNVSSTAVSRFQSPPARLNFEPPPPQPLQPPNYPPPSYHQSQWDGPYNTYNYCQPEPPKMQLPPAYPPLTSVPPPGFQPQPTFQPQYSAPPASLPPPPIFNQKNTSFGANYNNSYDYNNYTNCDKDYHQQQPPPQHQGNHYNTNTNTNNYENRQQNNFNNRNYNNKRHNLNFSPAKKTFIKENNQYNNYQNKKLMDNNRGYQQASNNKVINFGNFGKAESAPTRKPVVRQVNCEASPEKKAKIEDIVKEEEEDEETRQYRLKIEEQKRERQRILEMKEQRRRLQLQKEQEEPPKPLITKPPETPTTRIKIEPPTIPKKVVVNNNVPQIDDNKPINGFMANRVVLVKAKNNITLTNVNNIKPVVCNNTSETTASQSSSSSSFFNNRKIITKDNNLINTKLVTISNLSASTTTQKLVGLTQGIGEIQNLRMDAQERQATIHFKSVASAHAFFKKYQRFMLDLSMIEVKLESML